MPKAYLRFGNTLISYRVQKENTEQLPNITRYTENKLRVITWKEDSIMKTPVEIRYTPSRKSIQYVPEFTIVNRGQSMLFIANEITPLLKKHANLMRRHLISKYGFRLGIPLYKTFPVKPFRVSVDSDYKVNISVSEEDLMEVFSQRMKNHKDRVIEMCKILENNYPTLDGLYNRSLTHDNSTFHEPELTPYKLYYYVLSKKLPISEDLKNAVKDARYFHVLSNDHHPEFHSKVRTIQMRDEINVNKSLMQMINATEMRKIHIAEMIADWFSLAIENNFKSAKDYAEKVLKNTYIFTNNQKARIFTYIKCIEENY